MPLPKHTEKPLHGLRELNEFWAPLIIPLQSACEHINYLTPERKLVVMVMDRAIRDLEDEKLHRDIKIEVREWFLNPANDPYSFKWCCDILELQPTIPSKSSLRLLKTTGKLGDRITQYGHRKPAVTSVTLWGSIIGLLPILNAAYEFLAQNQGLLPPQIVPWVAAVSAVVTAIGRLRSDIKPINSILVTKPL